RRSEQCRPPLWRCSPCRPSSAPAAAAPSCCRPRTLADPRPLAVPLPCKGKLRLWDVPAELLPALGGGAGCAAALFVGLRGFRYVRLEAPGFLSLVGQAHKDLWRFIRFGKVFHQAGSTPASFLPRNDPPQ